MAYKRKTIETEELRKMIKDGKKKSVRMNEGATLYSVGINTFRELAVDAGAIYKLKKITLVNTVLIDEYLEHFREDY